MADKEAKKVIPRIVAKIEVSMELGDQDYYEGLAEQGFIDSPVTVDKAMDFEMDQLTLRHSEDVDIDWHIEDFWEEPPDFEWEETE